MDRTKLNQMYQAKKELNDKLIQANYVYDDAEQDGSSEAITEAVKGINKIEEYIDALKKDIKIEQKKLGVI